MALAETTLSSAMSATDTSMVVASATSIAPGRVVQIDGEQFTVRSDYASGTTVNLARGQGGTVGGVIHASGARVTHGLASDFPAPAPATYTNYPVAGRARQLVSVSATSTLTLPVAGSDLFVILNGTSVITLTIPVPTKDMDGCELTLVGNGVAAHVLTFTGGLSGAGGSYDVITVNATAPTAVKVVAVNELWYLPIAVGLAGTVTNITGTLS